ncbi:hypothetical protein DPMN_106445 [Dreissena polymorpha]|uniref:Uncharacterized protein n=1 Tax=Dreissena polymorpha TaxID=45954 RepID=A0A9D4QIV9_DREPO|nr:hypothetical protein DPMN_106445 [Dreissena polymorpha]
MPSRWQDEERSGDTHTEPICLAGSWSEGSTRKDDIHTAIDDNVAPEQTAKS